MNSEILPDWFNPACEEVAAAYANGRLAHALLIHEDPGAGGFELARWIAKLVNCRERGRTPCGKCKECQWIASDQHPDVTRLSPQDESAYILIEAVRDLIADLALTAHGQGYKVAILSPADALYHNAAQSLLKTLEEPPPRTLLLLVASQPSRLGKAVSAANSAAWPPEFPILPCPGSSSGTVRLFGP